ncbi:hypothetical protein AXYL_00632 [Achromobacter xylosoxidans A8]|uniref:Uncharacterized protein n=1 Tax=Achromobacter xylosoxidans (strain A8) TaxID=762376 RepID=E3HE80_ACHXA|nr:hypothetical protein [Achromobacter xylosoxidans]ADP13990.1 hypothetical protein AXYL_00632 [Achromobacter xylosoxidans A8]
MNKTLPAAAPEAGRADDAQDSRKAAAAWGRRFFWHLCLYIGLILVFVLQAQPTTGSGGPIKVEFQYQQF